MIKDIAQELRTIITNYSKEDKLIFRNKVIPIKQEHFSSITQTDSKTITYIDGGQAEILQAGNFCLSFIRIGAAKFKGGKRLKQELNEFYVLITAKTEDTKQGKELVYEAKIFQQLGEQLVNPELLSISSQDSSIKTGSERAPIKKVAQMARRFGELNYAKKLAHKNYSDYFILDGSLDPTYKNEETIIRDLPNNIAALAKSSSLFTQQGNSPNILLSNIGPLGIWSYFVEGKTYLVKLHENAKHVLRFDGNKEILLSMTQNTVDPIFLGYPYGLIFIDRIARVSKQEKESLKITFLLNKENEEIAKYLSTTNAHEILDSIS